MIIQNSPTGTTGTIHARMEIKSEFINIAGAEFGNMKEELELELQLLAGSYSLSGYFLLLNTP